MYVLPASQLKNITSHVPTQIDLPTFITEVVSPKSSSNCSSSSGGSSTTTITTTADTMKCDMAAQASNTMSPDLHEHMDDTGTNNNVHSGEEMENDPEVVSVNGDIESMDTSSLTVANGVATIVTSSAAHMTSAIMTATTATATTTENGHVIPEGTVVLMSAVPKREIDDVDTDGEALLPRKQLVTVVHPNGDTENVTFLIQQATADDENGDQDVHDVK